MASTLLTIKSSHKQGLLPKMVTFVLALSALAAISGVSASSALASENKTHAVCRHYLRTPVRAPVAASFGPRLEPITLRVVFGTSQVYATHEDQLVSFAGAGRIVAVILRDDEAFVTVRHRHGYVVQYRHLVEALGNKGDLVQKGGYLGKTTDRPFSIRVTRHGKLVDPATWLCRG
ncbi:MAG: hypothetical protein KGI75_22085 [Rhizobiaceae bacterium]|nr:hypothetical protein [Rhizobiaceae bacterium]